MFFYLSWYYISRDKYSDGLVPRIKDPRITWVSKVLWKNAVEYSPEIERLSEISEVQNCTIFKGQLRIWFVSVITDF